MKHVNVHKTQWVWLSAACGKMNKNGKALQEMCLFNVAHLCLCVLTFIVVSLAHQSVVCKFAHTVGG